MLHDSWSISAALASGFSNHRFEWGVGPEDEVVFLTKSETTLTELETTLKAQLTHWFWVVGKLVGTDSDHRTPARYVDVFPC